MFKIKTCAFCNYRLLIVPYAHAKAHCRVMRCKSGESIIKILFLKKLLKAAFLVALNYGNTNTD